ncbi:MAG: ribonuclease III, partial [Moorella sp. (in: Bacteria)]|nr:ribonuclease III [Moorella sp. (in: firmicutes)]
MIARGFAVSFRLKPEEMPVLVLAYLGDAVYELAIRRHLVALGITRIDKLHREAVKYVRADFQAGAMRRLEPGLSEEERAIARRGRNAKSAHPPRGLTPENYH